jgi:hypothetical protein
MITAFWFSRNKKCGVRKGKCTRYQYQRLKGFERAVLPCTVGATSENIERFPQAAETL